VTNRVSFICHSQGGTTVRYLLYLLSGEAPVDLPQFPRNDERKRAKAVITLGTPHKGTTVTNVMQVSTQRPDISLARRFLNTIFSHSSKAAPPGARS
jgi:triacylglycerol esterase/lipase EstA (alpha/beta hydrolase family)